MAFPFPQAAPALYQAEPAWAVLSFWVPLYLAKEHGRVWREDTCFYQWIFHFNMGEKDAQSLGRSEGRRDPAGG